MVTRDVLKVFQIALVYGSCNFENFQNITRAHKSRNALVFMQFPILISENLRPPLLDLVPRLGCELEKMTSYVQKYLTG